MRLLRGLFALALLLIIVVCCAFALADTEFGHRQIANRIERLAPRSGLKIGIGRIDGSIYGKAIIRDLVLSDLEGRFLSADAVTLDWTPIDWFENKLTIKSLTAGRVDLVRLPRLNKGEAGKPLLPGFEIDLGRIAIADLRIAKGVAGPERRGRLAGQARVRKGQASGQFVLDAQEGDQINLALTADPEHNLFDADAQVAGPSGGFVGALLGTKRAINLALNGDGNWQDWRGQVEARLDNRRVASLALTAEKGQFRVKGQLLPAPYLSGKAQRLSAPVVRLEASGRLQDRRITGTLTAESQALWLSADGQLDLATSSFRDVEVDARLRQPQALFANMRGQNIRLLTRLNGGFRTPRYAFLLTAPLLAFEQTGLEQVRATGRGRYMGWPIVFPAEVSVRRITGLGNVAGGILGNIRITGPLQVSRKALTGDGLMLRSDKLDGRVTMLVDLMTGRYSVGLLGRMARYFVPGLGVVDITSDLRGVPGPNGRGLRVTGRGKAWVRRFDNAFLLDLAGGLPQLDATLERGPDGILYFRDFKLTAPGLTLNGSGRRMRDGSFSISARGRQARYGALTMQLDGPIERPKLAFLLDQPDATLGLRAVSLDLVPNAQGYGWRASGGSRGGPFIAHGALLLPKGKSAVVDIDDLNLSGMRARGEFRPVENGLDGELGISGQGVTGVLEFSPTAKGQRIRANLDARDARLAGPPQMSAGRMKVDGDIVLDQRGMTVDATVTGEGLNYGPLTFARVAANVRTVNGEGEVRASFSGERGRSYDLQTVAQVTPGSITLVGQGTIDQRPVKLLEPAQLKREGNGWRLAPTAFAFAGGKARVGGRFAPEITEVDGNLEDMPMAILDMFNPGLGLGGTANGGFTFRAPTRGFPSGQTDLKIRGLSRAGLVLTSKPIDLALAAVLGGGAAGARMVATSDGKAVGRAQIQLKGIEPGGDLITRMIDANLFGQLRFSGEAGTLWRLTGVENFDVSGPVAIGADIGGSLRKPQISGSVRTSNAQIESSTSGMVLTNVEAQGNFDGSRLLISQLSAKSGKAGTVNGGGVVEFARAAPGIDLSLEARAAPLLARDDITAIVSGPIRIKSDGESGEITGDVVLDRSSFRLGQVNAAQVSRLNVREASPRPDEPELRAPTKPWRLNFTARAPGRLMVTGLGIDSEWRADLGIGGTVDNPAIRGIATLVNGDYDFAGKRFELERGTIRFDGSSPPDPSLDIVAIGDTQGLNATIRVAGTGLKPQISFASIPALPQDEILSRLLFGTSITNLSAPEAVQLAAAVSALRDGGTGLNPINALRQAVGLDRLRILPADSATGQSTAIAAGKYITRRTYVEIITDGKGYSATRAEFQITRWIAILSTISTIGSQSVKVRISKDY